MIHLASIEELRDSFRNSKITSQQISRSLLEACEDKDEINAWAIRHGDPRTIQNHLDHAPLGRLSGLVIGVKDVIATKEFPTRMGVTSDEWIGTTGGFDARIVSKLRSEGAVIAGKNTTSEFAVHLPTPVQNPRYPDSITGTSSSGSVAAVASGQISISLATQTGGSIARPASFCGVIGFKPSFGMFPRTGILKTTERFDTVGVIGRRVKDLAEIFSAGRIHGPNHPLHSKISNAALRNVRVLSGNTIDEASDQLRSRLKNYAKELAASRDLNYIDEELNFDFETLRQSYLDIYSFDLSYFLRDELDKPGISNVLRETVSGINRKDFEYLESLKFVQYWVKTISKELEGTIFLSLAASSGAPKHDKIRHLDANAFWTIAGLPQVVVPVLRDDTRKLVGVSFTSSKWTDTELLEFTSKVFPLDANSVPSL